MEKAYNSASTGKYTLAGNACLKCDILARNAWLRCDLVQAFLNKRNQSNYILARNA